MPTEHSTRFKQFQGQNILAMDYGTKVTGLAFFCPGKDLSPWPYGRIIVKDDESTFKELALVIQQEEIHLIVLGIPLLLDGQETSMSRKVKDFGQKLIHRFPTIPVFFQDETLSTYEAEERMKNSPRFNFKVDLKQIDAVAASLILEEFIRMES